MSTSRRRTSNRGSAQVTARRPRVAGHRQRPPHDPVAADTTTTTPGRAGTELAEPESAEPAEEGSPSSDGPDSDGPDSDGSDSDRAPGDRAAGDGRDGPERSAVDEVPEDERDEAATAAVPGAGVGETPDSPGDSGTDSAAQDVEPTDARSRTEPESEVGTEVGTETGTDDETGAEDETGTNTDTDTNTETDTGVDTDTDAAESASDGSDDAERDSDEQDVHHRGGVRAHRRPVLLTAVMLVLTVGFAGLAYWFHTEAYSLRNEGAAANRALVDQATTSQVKGQVTEAVETLFSYDYANTAKTEQAAKKLLTGEAVKQYDKLFETVKKQAPKQKLVLTTTVQAAGVTRLQGDRAEVLLFVDQNATRTASGKNGIYPAQLTVSAEKHGDQWKISRITPL